MDGDNTGLDEFQSFLDNDAPKPADSIKQAMVLTQDTQPDRQAQIINLSKSLNLPPSVVDSNFDEFQKKHAVESVPYDSIAEETPGFGAWLQDPNNAALAKDDLEALGSIEKKVRHDNSVDSVFDTIMTNMNESIPGITKRFLYRTASQISKVPALAYNAFRQVENAQRAALALGGLETEAGEYAPESWVKNKASNYWNAKLAEEQAKVPELGQSVFETYKKDGASAASKILLMQAADNVPQQLALIATALSGFGTAGLVGMGVTSAADSLEQGYNSKAGPEAATFGAITKGSIEAGFESLGTLGFLHHWENAIANSLGKSASKEIIKDFFKTIAYSFMGEGTEEGLTSVAQDLTDYYTGVNPDALKGIGQRAFDSAIVGGVMGGLLTGPSAIASGTARFQNQQIQNKANVESQAPKQQDAAATQSQEGEIKAPSLKTYSPDVSYAERARDTYLQIGDASDNNKLKDRSPEKLKEVIKASLNGTGKENIYISPEAIDAKFADPALRDKFLQTLSIAKQYDDAKEAGIAIKVPTEEWVSALKGTPEYKSLADEIKFSDLAESVSENKVAREKLKQDTKRTAEEAQKDMISQGAEDVANQVVAQLQDTRTYSKTGLNRVKELVQSHFATRGEILQRDPREIYKEEGFNVKQFEDLPAELKGALEQNENYYPVERASDDDLWEITLDSENYGNTSATAQWLGQYYSQQLSADGDEQRGEVLANKYKFDRVVEVQTIQVDPSVQGKGIATKLLKSLLAEAKANEADAVILNASPMGDAGLNLKELVSFYKKNGFKVIDKTKYNQTMLFDMTSKKATVYFQEELASKVPSQNTAPAFYSKSIQLVEQKVGNTATPEQINGVLKEIKPEERKWMGIDEFLKGKTKVSKQELLDHLKANQLQIEEVTKGAVTDLGDFPKLAELDQANADYDLAMKKVQDIKNSMVDDLLKTAKKRKWPYSKRDIQQIVSQMSMGRGEDLPNRMDAFLKDRQLEGAVDVKPLAEAINSQQEVFSKRYQLGIEFSNFEQTKRRGSDTKFSQYTLPGGDNYREVLFRLPDRGVEKIDKKAAREIVEAYRKSSVDGDMKALEWGMSQDEANAAIDAKEYDKYRSSHFNETNVLAHTRLNDRVDSEGKKILFIEEIQSDWHQAGRKSGYVGDVDVKAQIAELDTRMKELVKQYEPLKGEERKVLTKQYIELQNQKTALENTDYKASRAVPDAPFRKTWHEFVLKRLIREAAEKGYDKIAWTTGEQQADRYDLSKQIDAVEYVKHDNGTYNLFARKDGDYLIKKRDVQENDLEGLIGKELAAKIIANEGKSESKKYSLEKSEFTGYWHVAEQGRGDEGYFSDGYTTKKEAQKVLTELQLNQADGKTLEGLDLKVGGEGMKGFYDKILVDFANKFVKKYGAKVENTKIGDKQLQMAAETVHSITLTPELKQAALNEGFPLFQADQDTRIVRGFFDRVGNLIGLTKHKNLSTFLHEYGHSLLSSAQNDYNYIKSLGDTLTSKQEQFVTDMDTLLKHLGANSFDNLNRDQQEEFARSFEAYLMKGKAPTKGLKKAFATFKSWMLKIYAQAKNLKVNLTPELSEIFDRMIAVEDAIFEQQQKFPALLRESTGDIPQPSEGKMADLMKDAKDYSLSKVSEPSLEYVLKKQEKFYKEERKVVKQKLLEELDKNPNQKALLDIINEKTSIESASLKDRGDLPSKYFSTDGTPASVLADIYGYHDEALFVDSLKEAYRLRTEGVEAEADAEMQRRYKDGFTDLEQNALEVIHNEYNKERLRLEAEFLAEKAGGDKKVAEQLIRRLRSDAEIKAETQRIISQTTTKDIKPYIYERAEIKSAREAAEFYRKGDYVSAFEAKRKEILNHELFKAAYEAQKNIQKAAGLFKKFYKPDEKLAKSKDMNIINAGRAVLVQYGFAATDKAVEDYLQPLSTYDPAGYESVKAIVESMTLFPGYWADISYGQFSQLKEDVEALYSLAAESKNFEVNKEKMQLETVVNSFVEQAALHPERNQVLAKDATRFDNFNAKFLSKLASFTRIEHMTKLFDLGTRGVWTNYFWEPINQAFIKYQAARNENIKELFDLTKEYRKNLTWEKIDGTKELGSTGVFKNKAVLIAALKHIGNESNLRKLLVGYNWGQLQEDGTLDTSRWDAFIKRMQAEGVLTKADYDYVQGIWDLHEKIKPEAQKVHKKDTGYYFDEITAREIQTPFGTYKGGYVPLKYDKTANRTVQRNSTKESILTGDFGFEMPSTSKGFTKSRVEFNAPLSLDLSQTLQDFDDVLKYIHLRLPVKQGVRLLYNKEFSNMVDKLNPQLMENALEPFLLRAAQNKVEFNDPRADKEFAAAARFLKSYSTASTMALNITNALQNYSSLFPAQVRIDPSAATSLNQTRHAFVQYVTNRKETLDFIASKSAYMNTEMTDGAAEAQRDLRDIALKPGLVTSTTEFLQANSFALMQMTQKQTSSIVWLAAYNAAIAKENATDAEAVAHADSVVRTTQGAGRAIDVSKFETGSAWWRAFTMYSGFFLNLANLNASEMTVVKRTLGMRDGASRLFFVYSFGFMLTAVSADLLMKAINGRGFDEDDDESYLDDFIGTFLDSQYRMGTAMLPLVGPALNAAKSYFNDKPYDDKLSLSPVVNTLESAAHGLYSGYKLLTDPEDFKKRDLKDGFTLLGLAASAVADKTVPLSALNKPAGYLLDYMNGDANPENPVDFTKGLIRGREVSK